jgi:hypothetical protein
MTGESATFTVSVAGGEKWTTSIDVEVATATQSEARIAGQHPRMDTDLPGWLHAMPRLETGWSTLAACYQRSLVNLAALRSTPT